MPNTTVSQELDELIATVSGTEENEEESQEEEDQAGETEEEKSEEDQSAAEDDKSAGAELEEYRKRLNDMAKLAMQAPQPITQQQETQPTPPAQQPDDITLTQEEYDEAINSPAGFSKIMDKVRQRARVELLREIPQIVEKQVSAQLGLKLAVQQFYDLNKDLVPFRSVVALKVRELEMQHPDWGYDKIFQSLGKEVRTYLRLPSASGQASKNKSSNQSPAFPNTKSGRKTQSDNRTPIQRELDELSHRR